MRCFAARLQPLTSFHFHTNRTNSIRTKTISAILSFGEQAQKQAAENGLTLEGESKQLILHGLRHLCGYAHETDDGEMNELELVLRVQLAIQ
ncbi:MAG: rRNA maturation RNAse YbeY [Chloracidobacterium sp.]|nr:rRNA maturation RNAse YbeY [Chloracidobacterium sp.]